MFKTNPLRSLLLAALFMGSAVSQPNILTNRYNQSRTSANLNEAILTPANVNTATFGKLGTYTVDGVIYAQPLYIHGLAISGATNVLFIATMHDVVYAFDADAVGSSPLWTLDFRSSSVAPAPIHIGSNPTSDPVVADTFGILGTPVIDLPNNRMFLVTHTLEGGAEHFRLRSVNILTGALNNSTDITASVAASGPYAAQAFNPSKYAQRPGLELVNGQVWIGFGSRAPGDYLYPWQGWVMTYDANSLAQTGVFVTSRTSGNSVWQSGNGPAVDSGGNVYYLTGNGGTYTAGLDLPESLLQFSFGTGLTLKNWYTPDSTVNGDSNDENYVFLNNYDLDLSCNGPVLIPGTNLITFGSKTADVFVLNTADLGQLLPGDPQVVQFFHVGKAINTQVNDSDRIVGMAYWQQGGSGTLFVWPGLDTLHAYSLNATTSHFSQTYAGSLNLPGQPSTALAVSANGSTNGILWAPVMNVANETNYVGQPGILHAYNASNPSQELWNSNLLPADNMGSLPKFTPPVVVNGKVYMANSANLSNYSAGSVTVYGLKGATTTNTPSSVAAVAGAPQSTFAGASFANALQAKVTNSSGTPLGGISVTFSAPVSGAGATFSGSSSASAVTNSSGVAASPIPVANSAVGTYNTSASVSGVSTAANFSLTNTALPGGALMQVDAGSASNVGSWSADTAYTGGNLYSTTAAINTSAPLAAPAPVYQTERWGVFSYTFGGLIPGSVYDVQLHFAEIVWTYPGQRVFNIAINGTQVLTNFDIVATAGGPNVAIVKSFSTTANAAGQITVSSSIGAADNPKISAIAILGTPAVVSSTAQIDAGSSSPIGNWSSDSGYTGGNTYSTNAAINTSAPLSGPAAVYQTERWGLFSYTFSGLTPAGVYSVQLHFAEIYWTQPRQRLFNMSINGAQVLTNFDIIATAGGPNTAVVKTFTAIANSSGQIVVSSSLGAADSPKISAIALTAGAPSSASNVYAIFNNGAAPAHGGFDSEGYAYSATLVGNSITWSGSSFALGASGVADAFSGGTISLPAGNYPTLKLLAAGVNGNQTNQTFVVTYTDGTTSTFVQNLSDWGTPQNYTGESKALSTSYRITPSGATQGGPWYIYGYSFSLNNAKTVKSIALPGNRNVVVLAITL